MTKIAPETQQTRAEWPSNMYSISHSDAVSNNRHPTISSVLIINLPLFRGLFGPEQWCKKAARVLKVSPQMVWHMVAGRRRIGERHWAVMQAYAGRREVNILTEHRRRLAEVDEVYRQAVVDLQAARRVLEARQGQRSRGGR